jgi:hypothetical protein
MIIKIVVENGTGTQIGRQLITLEDGKRRNCHPTSL